VHKPMSHVGHEEPSRLARSHGRSPSTTGHNRCSTVGLSVALRAAMRFPSRLRFLGVASFSRPASLSRLTRTSWEPALPAPLVLAPKARVVLTAELGRHCKLALEMKRTASSRCLGTGRPSRKVAHVRTLNLPPCDARPGHTSWHDSETFGARDPVRFQRDLPR